MTAVQHSGEPKSNTIRQRLAAIEGIGQRTYTPTQVVVKKAKGVILETLEGRKLYDFTSGVLVTNLGHAHPRFETLYQQYCGELPRSSYNMVTEVEVEASERIIRSMKHGNPKAEKVLWAASGSEGIQKAMWCALHKHPDRPIILATRYGFHGKKGLAGDTTGCQSSNPNVRFISFPMYEEKPESFYQNELDTLAAEFPNKIALLITEPYLGAAGSFHPPKWYHKLLQRWCEAHDVAFIFDEVQSCHGRTGNMYAFETYDVQPDLVVLGKGLGNGEPAAAVAGRADLIDALTYGEASDTFSANPRACAAACAVFDVFEEEGIVDHCRAVAPVMREKLESLVERFPFAKAVRGEGLVYGLEMSDKITAERCVLEAYRGIDGMGVHFLGPLAEKVLRVSPPLIITEKDINAAFDILYRAWQRVG
ncbi:MAG TPA: aspartate aminotransferase family protein [Candidatus Hydrogenedentes bacterium]|nr:aspartate aminotransferase family protein [Candidatus Hydrogenedentota bacterium]HOL77257.1 aspartate aminotransferase family protein [Candidatus Hydrogenedentota bacterium]HPO86547.1 aspartate aminotransferase family protein [Candidatus Hydrogenedentota bacterium]